jgi:hypothetical protein
MPKKIYAMVEGYIPITTSPIIAIPINISDGSLRYFSFLPTVT